VQGQTKEALRSIGKVGQFRGRGVWQADML
jgi:hypothetical protein